MRAVDFERNCLAWKDLMDFGWEFCLQVYPQTYPGRDPMDVLRDAYERASAEHLAANERMVAAASGPDGQ